VSSVPLVEERIADDGIALTLSGGGYRAMLFHVGALWRLNELGILGQLSRISSVSGGSIVNGRLARVWRDLRFRDGIATAFDEQFVQPVRRFAARTVDWQAVLTGWFTRRPIANCLADIYDQHLLHGMRLHELPDDESGEGPRFIFNATSLQTGTLFRFGRDHAGDYRVGRIDVPTLRLSHAVAASSSFPPMLAPLVLDIPPRAMVPGTGKDLEVPPYTTRAILADGGIYDNLGLEGVWWRYRRILVSDASGLLNAEPQPSSRWLSLVRRSADTQGAQVRDLRVRQLLAAYQLPESEVEVWRRGAYWGIGADITSFDCPGSLACPHDQTSMLAAVPTRLAATPAQRQEQLINWGYAICDASVRRWFVPDAPPPKGFPYPGSAV
jgi:NTE family protein